MDTERNQRRFRAAVQRFNVLNNNLVMIVDQDIAFGHLEDTTLMDYFLREHPEFNGSLLSAIIGSEVSTLPLDLVSTVSPHAPEWEKSQTITTPIRPEQTLADVLRAVIMHQKTGYPHHQLLINELAEAATPEPTEPIAQHSPAG